MSAPHLERSGVPESISSILFTFSQSYYYTGLTQIPGYTRYAVTYGPVLLAARGMITIAITSPASRWRSECFRR